MLCKSYNQSMVFVIFFSPSTNYVQHMNIVTCVQLLILLYSYVHLQLNNYTVIYFDYCINCTGGADFPLSTWTEHGIY